MPNLAKFFLGALLGVGAAAGAASGGHRTVSVFDQLHQNDLIIKTPDGQRLYLTSLGKGPPVLVIAGGPGMNYEYLVDAFVGLSKTHKVIFLEQRGNLLSPAAPDKVSFDKAVDDIEFARKALSLGPLTLAAHSTGTRTAVGYYSKHPRTVAKLILIGSFPPFVDKDWQPSNMAEKLSTRPQVTQLVERLGLNLEDDLKTHKIKIEDVTPQMASDYWRIKFAAANIYHIERWRQVEGGRIFLQ